MDPGCLNENPGFIVLKIRQRQGVVAGSGLQSSTKLDHPFVEVDRVARCSEEGKAFAQLRSQMKDVRSHVKNLGDRGRGYPE